MTLSLSTGKALAFGPEGLRGTLLPQPDCCCWQAKKVQFCRCPLSVSTSTPSASTLTARTSLISEPHIVGGLRKRVDFKRKDIGAPSRAALVVVMRRHGLRTTLFRRLSHANKAIYCMSISRISISPASAFLRAPCWTERTGSCSTSPVA